MTIPGQQITKGPWSVRWNSFRGSFYVVGGPSLDHRGREMSGRDIIVEDLDSLPNAALIAAGPEMFAALQRLVTLIDNGFLREHGWENMDLHTKEHSAQQTLYNQTVAAIKKATSREVEQ